YFLIRQCKESRQQSVNPIRNKVQDNKKEIHSASLNPAGQAFAIITGKNEIYYVARENLERLLVSDSGYGNKNHISFFEH
ncbi:hypothetical protein MXB_5291, partial [Myxobolus squamalis]